MVCQVCNIHTGDRPAKSNNCFLECLEKIKLHYLDMVKSIKDNTATIKELNEKNLKLQARLGDYERSKNPESDRSGWFSDVLENEILNKTADSLNVALNGDIDFDATCVSESPNCSQKQKHLKREPMKSITLTNVAAEVKSKPWKESKKIKEEVVDKSCLSKENKGVLQENISRRNDRSFLERPKLSLKSGLRQRRLQLSSNKKNLSKDSSFIQPSISSSFCMANIKSSPKTVNRLDDSTDNDITFELASPFKKSLIPKETCLTPKNETETSSVMILTPETQDIIFLDDSCDSNIESMDLLRDFVKPSGNRLNNLKLFESNRIKLLQKTASTKALTVPSDNEKQKPESDAASIMEDLEETNIGDLTSALADFDKTDLRVPKEKVSTSRDELLLRLNCAECQKYIKYLGDRLSDEEVEKHIRNCTKHKITDEICCTPEGFWDPTIKPLDKDDPRNQVYIDTRFKRK